MYLVSAYFDQDSVQKLQNLINAVAEETGNDYMIRNLMMKDEEEE